MMRVSNDHRKNRTLTPRLIGRGWWWAVLCLLVWACSQDQTPEPEKPQMKDTPIAFTGSMMEQEKVTRAGETSLTSVTSRFVVWAYKNNEYNETTNTYAGCQQVMRGFIVNYASSKWDYIGQGPEQTVKFWDSEAKAYRFFGYALRTGSTTTVEPTGDSPYDVSTATQVTLTANIDGSTAETRNAAPYFTELWFSNGNPDDYPTQQFGESVQLRFRQPFARVRFQFIASENLTLDRNTLANIGFHPTDGSNVPTKGNITVSYPLIGTATAETWNSSAAGGIKSLDIDWYEPNTSVTPANEAPTTYPNSPQHWYYVLPAINQDTYTVEVSIEGRQLQTAIVPAEYMIWKPGFEYTYVFKITQQGEVTFSRVQVAINEWVEGVPQDHTVYNW